jgi:hypothetical protein
MPAAPPPVLTILISSNCADTAIALVAAAPNNGRPVLIVMKNGDIHPLTADFFQL